MNSIEYAKKLVDQFSVTLEDAIKAMDTEADDIRNDPFRASHLNKPALPYALEVAYEQPLRLAWNRAHLRGQAGMGKYCSVCIQPSQGLCLGGFDSQIKSSGEDCIEWYHGNRGETMTTTKDKLEFALAMGRHTRATVRQVQALMRYAGTLQRLAEDDCNIATDDVGLRARELKRARIRSRVTDLCADLRKNRDAAPVLMFSGDPRGAVLKIRVPSGFSNSFGDEGIVVPS